VALSETELAALPVLIAAFTAAMLVSLVLVPLAIRLAGPLGVIDQPGAARRVHSVPIPRSGGLAVVGAFIAVAAAGSALGWPPQSPLALFSGDRVTLVLGGAVALLLGMADDRYQLRARWQLLGQVALAIGVVALGLSVDFINNPIGDGVIAFAGPLAVAVTVLWIVGMINSINFIDGLDGLSAGIGLIAALTLGVISLTRGIAQPAVGLLCFALAGALAGFLRWNFHPARVFLGTGGVMFLGYALAVLAIMGTAKVAVALLVLGVPIIDAFWIIVRRIAAGSSPFTPDRRHIHHRLLDLGLEHRQAVLLIYAICGVLAILALVLSGTGQLYAFVGIGATFGLVLFLLTRRALGPSELSRGAGAPDEEHSEPG